MGSSAGPCALSQVFGAPVRDRLGPAGRFGRPTRNRFALFGLVAPVDRLRRTEAGFVRRAPRADVVIVVVLPLTQLVVEQVAVVGDPVSIQELVELLVIDPIRALDLAV
jgi:hypothetical protein